LLLAYAKKDFLSDLIFSASFFSKFLRAFFTSALAAFRADLTAG